VHLACVKGFNLSNNIADGNQLYGLFPIVSQQGIVANNESKNTPLIEPLAADLSWDFTGSKNCWSYNQFNTSFPTTLASCN
jgi:hypothetical protein